MKIKISHFHFFTFTNYFSLLIFSYSLLITSCSNPEKQNQKLNVFRYNESAGITSLDPAFAKDQANIWACNQLYNGLVQLDDNLIIKPCIAKSWNISEDGLTYTFKIRQDVFFHDDKSFHQAKGRKVIADDFVYSFNRIVNPKIASPGAWVFNNVKRISNLSSQISVFALNDSVLKIKLKEPFAPFLGLLSMQYCSVVPKEAIEYYGKEFRKYPVGTGPFCFRLWKEGVKMVLVKNKNYFELDDGKRLPFLDAVAVTFIIDKQTAFLEFVKGNIDFISGIDQSYKDELLTNHGTLNPKYKDKFNLIRQPYLNTEYLGFLCHSERSEESLLRTTNNELRTTKFIRQAINYGIDRRKMLKYLRNNIGEPGIHGMVPNVLLRTTNYELRTINYGYDYNPEKAKQLLAEAGYPEGKNLPEITLSTTSSYLDLCKYMQQELAEIGIKLNIDVTPPATLREMIAKSKLPFFRGSWIADYPDAENYLSLFYTKNFTPNGPNYTHFSNKEFDELYEKAIKETDENKRREYYLLMDKLVMDEAPLIVLYYDEVLRFVSKNISGLGSNPLNLLTLKKVRRN